MARPTVAGNAYRWAWPVIERMIRGQPGIAVDLLRADTATKHFVALAVRGWELRQDGCERALRQMSEDLFSRPRSAVLAVVWGVGLGKLGFLKRLPGRVLPRRHYDHLVAAWSDPARRKLISQCARISPREIETIALFDQPLEAASARAIGKIGAELFDYVMAVIRRHRPDLDDISLAAALRELKRAEDLADWLRNVLRLADLPPPPWPGTETIIPLRSVAEIGATGLEFRNCLAGEDWWLAAVLGQRCFYRVSGRDGPAIVSVAFDPLLGAWRVESYRGPANAVLKPAIERRTLKVFAAAGILYFGEYPRGRALDWADGFLNVP
jgi:hypothetical protein